MLKSLNMADDIADANSRITKFEQALGKGLMQPFNNTNSGSRKIMQGTQREHVLPLYEAEVAVVQTGHENQFGHYSSSFVKSDAEYRVVSNIPKFSNLPKHHYWLILADDEKKQLNTIERISYKHISETYGYQYNNGYLDSLECGDTIHTDDVVKKSVMFDEVNNRMDGVNMLTVYTSCDVTMEDGIKLSESGAKKFDAPLFKKVTPIINDNDILLNLYGDENTYKTFPDIGEKIQQGILCATRREKNEEMLFAQSYNRLRDVMMSDDKFTTEGTVIDINVYCNNPEKLKVSHYNSQIRYYYNENIRFCNMVVSQVSALLAEGYTMTYTLQKLYYTCKDIIDGKQYTKDRPFSNIIMEVMVLERNHISKGDKLSDRFGGKGVVSEIVPDHMMYKLENGEYAEMQCNSSTVYNRINPGQLFETSVTHISNRIIDLIYDDMLDSTEGMDIIHRYVHAINKEQANHMITRNMWIYGDSDEMASYIHSVCLDGGIMVSVEPVSNGMDIDKLNSLYQEFPWVEQCKVTTPINDSNGNIRYIEARRPIVVGRKYMYRLKQYAEEKFSVTSLSATNIKNENSRSKANKEYKGVFTKTPIRFGEMETGDMAHLGMEAVIINLMLHSTSPHGRRLAEELLTGDPFDINIQLDETAKNRSVEMANVYFKTMGLKLVFEKISKNIRKPMLKQIMTKIGTPRRRAMLKVGANEAYDPAHIENIKNKLPKVMVKTLMRKI